jgi:hypothetical protein
VSRATWIAMDTYAASLADAVEAALPAWVERCVDVILHAWKGGSEADERVAAAEAGRRAGEEVGRQIRDLVATDVDQQRGTPLTILRQAVRYPTEVLLRAGVPPVERDGFEERAFPDDLYGLTPASFADIDPRLVEPAVAWGAAKAWEHLRRHGS